MNRHVKLSTTCIYSPTYDVAESIEEQMRRVTTEKQPIESTAPLIYTEESEGVLAGYDIRTDRFEVAVEAMDKVTASETAKRDNAASAAPAQETDNQETTFITE